MKTIALLVVALGASGMAAMSAQSWLSSSRSQPSPIQSQAQVEVKKPTTSTQVLVARGQIEPGSFIQPGDLEWQAWPDDGVNSAYVMRRSGESQEAEQPLFDGAVATQAITPGQPISAQLLVQAGERGFLSAVLAPGMRAVTLPVDETRGIAGLIFPGDRVDLILSRTLNRSGGDDRFLSQTVLGDVRILAVDQTLRTISPKPSEAEETVERVSHPRTARTVTVEVKPDQAERIALALSMGTLSLSLRSIASDAQELSRLSTFTSDQVFPAPAPMKPPASRITQVTQAVRAPRDTPIRSTRRVTVLRGTPSGSS